MLTLETPRLVLRPMTEADRDALLTVFTDPHVMAAFDSAPFDTAMMERWLRHNLDHQARYGYGLFAVILKADGTLMGDCGLMRLDVDGVDETELGYDLRSDCWGQGYATEAAGAVRDAAFTQLGLERLVSLIRVGNTASRRVAERVGMQWERYVHRDGRWYWLYSCERGG